MDNNILVIIAFAIYLGLMMGLAYSIIAVPKGWAIIFLAVAN